MFCASLCLLWICCGLYFLHMGNSRPRKNGATSQILAKLGGGIFFQMKYLKDTCLLKGQRLPNKHLIKYYIKKGILNFFQYLCT